MKSTTGRSAQARNPGQGQNLGAEPRIPGYPPLSLIDLALLYTSNNFDGILYWAF